MASSPGSDPRAVLRAFALTPKRTWGQNFLCAEGTCARLVAAARGLGAAGAPIVELGAGTGALTEPLAALGAPLFAVERDRELAVVLRRRLAGRPEVFVVEADAARLDLAALLAERGLAPPARVVGNLPYQVASRILVHLAARPASLAGGLFMVQREVAARLAAAPGGRDFSLLSVLVQRAFVVTSLFDVPPTAFFPRPRVTSRVVRLAPRAAVAGDDAALVAAARLGFSARRRTLARALADRLGVARDQAAALLAGVGIAPAARAETLDVPAFARLGGALAAHGLLAAPAGAAALEG